MKSVIICEGNTDLLLIQYFLEKVYSWQYIKRDDYSNYEDGLIDKIKIRNRNDVKWFSHKNGNILCILSSGGVSGIPRMLRKVLDLNKLGTVKSYDNIAIITDRDEINTEEEFIKVLTETFFDLKVGFSKEVDHNIWNKAYYVNDIQDEYQVNFLPLIIPFEDTGTIELFL